MLDFKLPEVGENIESGTVVNIAVSVGDAIKKDQDLLEIETDKASLPVPAPCDGVVKEILISDGQDVKIGSVIMKIEEGASAESSKSTDEKPLEEKQEKETKEDKKPEEPKKETASETKAPAAKQPATSNQQPATKLSNEAIPAQKNVPAAPSVRRLARELGVIISQVNGTGPKGRISEDDVKEYVKNIMSSGGSASSGTNIPTKPLPDFTKFGDVEREKMSKIRQVTSDQMSLCWSTIPHVTQFDKADITDLEELRKKLNKKGSKLTVTPFLLKVMAAALKKFPQFNASIDSENQEIIYKKYVNLGVAVDTPNGLMVPVLRDVDQKSITQINEELNELAEKARNKRVGLDDLQGGSMTLTNLGGIGGHAFTPIVNWPEVAILGVSRGGLEPVWNGKEFEPKFKLPLNLSYDHRLIDGADAARFLRWICAAIEQPFMMELM